MFRIEMLPGGHGDSLWIEYGTPQHRHQILIDGGPLSAFDALKQKITELPKSRRKVDLLVVTHIDADHIEAPVRLLGERPLGLKIGEVWFNAWRHLTASEEDLLGPVQGEYLSLLIQENRLPWNTAFGERGVFCRSSEDGTCTIKGDLKITLLSPGGEELKKLRKVWRREVENAGLDPGNPEKARERLEQDKRLRPRDLLGTAVSVDALLRKPFSPDDAVANGSSIAFVAEFEGKSCLFAGDAHPNVLEAGITRLLQKRGQEKLKLDAFKIAHHGSKHNLSTELLQKVSCPRYLVSTNGNYFNHPDAEAIARVIEHGGEQPQIFFNYKTEENAPWGDSALMKRHKYSAVYPKAGQAGVTVDL